MVFLPGVEAVKYEVLDQREWVFADNADLAKNVKVAVFFLHFALFLKMAIQ